MAANTSQNETTVRRLLETLNGLWTACKNAFSPNTHTHSVKLNDNTITVNSSGGTAAELGYHPTARGVTATTVKGAIQELRVLPGGSMGSFQLPADNSVENIIIPSGWYNYIWTPHRTGASGGDNQKYGALLLTNMYSSNPHTFVVEGYNLASDSPTYMCRLLSQMAARGSAYFSNNATYRKIGKLSGTGSTTGDICATFLANINFAGVCRFSGILNIDIRSVSGTMTFNVNFTNVGAPGGGWTNRLKFYKDGNDLYIYGHGSSVAYYDVEVTPLAITNLSGSDVPRNWVPDTTNTAEANAPSYDELAYTVTQYVSTSSTSGLLKNDGSVDTTAYSQKPVAQSKFDGIHLLLGESNATPQSAAYLQYYGDNNNGHILMIGDPDGTKFPNKKQSSLRFYRDSGSKATYIIATGSEASNQLFLPTAAGGRLAVANMSGVGGVRAPVYVNSNGEIVPCDDPSLWTIGFASHASKLYASSYGGSNVPVCLKADGDGFGDASPSFKIPHTAALWHREINNGTITGVGITHYTSKFVNGPSDDLVLGLKTPSTNVLQLTIDAGSTRPWNGGQVWGTIKWDSQTGSNINSFIDRIGNSNLNGTGVVLASRNLSISNVQDIQGHALFAICTGDNLHAYVIDMEISVIKASASSTLCYISVMSKCFEEDSFH